MQFNLQNAQFDYEPYPICYIPNVLDPSLYAALRDSYPDVSLFKFKEALGNKYSLAEKNNPKQYYDFIKKNDAWREFYEHVKSKQFVEETLAFLKSRNIDIGLRSFRYVRSMQKRNRNFLERALNMKAIRSRFEFSIMRADGGHILPHADAPNKLITLVLSFIKKEEWNDAWGGGTDIIVPKDRTKIYNHLNGQLPFDQVEHVKTFPFEENQAVLFIKTYNSWHSVGPLSGPETGLRKTITINIENIP